MICPNNFLNELNHRYINFFCGVPDSLLKDFCACADSVLDKKSHIIAANEGNAVALAAGYHLATGKTGLVYFQNSGIGNALNPLLSLADQEVYQIPMILLIGWRGEPSIPDEPQHVKQGRITPALLDTMEIPYEILCQDSNYVEIIDNVISKTIDTNSPVAIIVRKGSFAKFKSARPSIKRSHMLRESALQNIISLSNPEDLFISTTGKTSRELNELRIAMGQASNDFLTVGSMGHASSIALGIALNKPEKRVICLDGDGALLMHLGSMAIIGDLRPPNMIHILLNNAAHESVGGQATVAGEINFKSLAISLGYAAYFKADSEQAIKDAWLNISNTQGPIFFELIINSGSRSNLSRPKNSPKNNKISFMEHADE